MKILSRLMVLLCLLTSGCGNSVSEESNDVILNENGIDVSEIAEVVEVTEQLTPDTVLDDEYVWMEGEIKEAEKFESGYRFTIVPWSQIPNEDYKTLVVEADFDLEIIWATSGETLSFEELESEKITRLVKVDVRLDEEATEDNPTGKITQMFLLVG